MGTQLDLTMVMATPSPVNDAVSCSRLNEKLSSFSNEVSTRTHDLNRVPHDAIIPHTFHCCRATTTTTLSPTVVDDALPSEHMSAFIKDQSECNAKTMDGENEQDTGIPEICLKRK